MRRYNKENRLYFGGEIMKRVLVWGTGKIAKEMIQLGINAEIIGMVETNKRNSEFMGLPVFSGTMLPTGYDYILVANSHTIEIFEFVQKMKYDVEKIIFLKFCPYYNARKNIRIIYELLSEELFQIYCNEYKLIDESFFGIDKKIYSQMNKRLNFAIDEKYLCPQIGDKYKNAGSVSNYFWQDLWAARLLYKEKPEVHFDIGSRLDGFIAHLLSFDIPVKMIDIRPFPAEIDGLETVVGDATTLHQFEDNSIGSLSALCSLEHFGLGRYGDPVNPEACFICFKAINEKVRPGGHVYISVPVGRERVEFNAHRVFYAQTIADCFEEFRLVEFACAADGKLETGVDLHKYDRDTHDGNYRYGLFHFVKYCSENNYKEE